MIVLTRGVSRSIAHCELTFIDRQPIDYEKARQQHARYEDLLRESGCQVRQIPPDDAFPDCVFIEDTAVVLDELAIITRPGAESRRGETAAVASALRPLRSVAEIGAPATIDGGDVLLLGRTLHVGLSTRTNEAAVAQLREFVEPVGYRVVTVAVTHSLHLKTAVTRVGESTLLLNPRWVDPALFPGWTIIEVDEKEPPAANALRIGDRVVHPAQFPRTRERLQRGGIDVRPVDVSEITKAEGGVTCCCVVVPTSFRVA